MSAITWRPVVLYQRGPLCLVVAWHLRLEVQQVGRCQTDQHPWRELQELALAHQKDQCPSQHLLQEEWRLGQPLGLQLQEQRLHQAFSLQRSWRFVQQQPPQDHPSECARLRQDCL